LASLPYRALNNDDSKALNSLSNNRYKSFDHIVLFAQDQSSWFRELLAAQATILDHAMYGLHIIINPQVKTGGCFKIGCEISILYLCFYLILNRNYSFV
jgi:hypothetical protein